MARVRSSMAVMRFSMSPMFILAIFGSPPGCFPACLPAGAGFEGGAVWRVRCSAFAFSRSVAARSAAARCDFSSASFSSHSSQLPSNSRALPSPSRIRSRLQHAASMARSWLMRMSEPS